MAEDPAPRRFYKTANVEPFENGFTVMLDARRLRTPGRAHLVLPTRALAERVADEWNAQVDAVVLALMPATRLAFTAIDRIAVARAESIAEVVSFASADLLCYRAEAPSNLVEQQTRRWGVLLDWAKEDLGLTFVRVTGIIHQPQPEATLVRIADLADAADDFALAGLTMATGLFGSAVLALALWRDQLDGDAAFELSRLDEAFQEAQWGVDEEAALRTAHRRAEAVFLDGWFQALC